MHHVKQRIHFWQYTAVNTVPECDASQQVSDFDDDGAVGLYRCTTKSNDMMVTGEAHLVWGFFEKGFLYSGDILHSPNPKPIGQLS